MEEREVSTMKEKVNITELQQASDYRTMRNTLRNGGTGSIVFGIIGIAIGLAAMEENPINAVLVIIGIGLLLEGIWVITWPSRAGFITEGLALATVGAWNIFITIGNNMEAGDGMSFFGVLGACQIYWGFKSFGQYGRFANISLQKPSKDVMDQVEEMIQAVLSAKAKGTAQLVELKEGNKSWKGTLQRDIAVLVRDGGQDVLFTDRDNINVLRKSDTPKGRFHEILLRVGDRSIEGVISPASFSTYEQWKHAVV
jgi:hypothetical protein